MPIIIKIKLQIHLRYSTLNSKRVSWKYEIEGVRDFKTEREKMVVETANEYKQQADVTRKAIVTVIMNYVIMDTIRVFSL